MLRHFSWYELQDLLEDLTKAVTKVYMHLCNEASLQTQKSYSACLSNFLLTPSNLKFYNVICEFKMGIKATKVNLFISQTFKSLRYEQIHFGSFNTHFEFTNNIIKFEIRRG